MAAIDRAIADGVNAINFSIGGGNSPFSDAVELAFLAAYDRGVFVAASAGNSGPGPDTVNHRGPWVTTVAASTSNRHFLSTVTLSADNGDTLTLVGATTTEGINTPTPVVIDTGNLACDPTFTVSPAGKIAICARVGARLTRGFNAAQAGAVGMLLYSTTQLGVLTDNHFIPTVHLDQGDGVTLVDFVNSHSTVGAENRFGNSGGVIFFNGNGAPPLGFGADQGVRVTSVAGVAGPVHTVTFKMKAEEKGKWQNCANLTADIFQGVAISCISGRVTR